MKCKSSFLLFAFVTMSGVAPAEDSANPAGVNLSDLRYRSLTGHTLDVTWLPHKARYTGQPKVDWRAVDYASWPLVKDAWVSHQTNSRNLTITIGGQKLKYDFASGTRPLSKYP